MKRALILAAAALVLAVVVYGRLRFNAMVAAQMPVLTEAPAGPAAPSYSYLGVVVGSSTLDDAKQAAEARGFVCEDRSMGTLVQKGVSQEVARKSASGESTLALRAYGWLNPHGRNPQTRLSCESTAGRLLFIFDNGTGPVRHVSLTTRFEALGPAQTAFLSASNGLLEVFSPGRPRRATPALEWLSPEEEVVSFSDLKVSVSAINYRERGVIVTQTAEVPWPIRGDAPGLRASALTSR